MSKLLLIVYKIDRDQGSEGGSGYHMAAEIIRAMPDVTLISRKDNIAKLESDPVFKNVRLIGIDVPRFLSFYKRRGFGITLYYYLWQICVGLKIWRLPKFDIIHQINFHATWAPHFIFGKGAKIIWGPLTQHADVPFDLWDEGIMRFAVELARRVVKRFFWYCDPFLRWAVMRSDKILLGHKVENYPYTLYPKKIILLPQAASVFPVTADKPQDGKFVILFVGRFLSLKGVGLALEAATEFAKRDGDTEIIFIGDGPLRPMGQHVRVLPWLPQPQLSAHYQRASVFLFPSLEGQGMVVAEAMAHGCPVMCLVNTGPYTVAGETAVCRSMMARSSSRVG